MKLKRLLLSILGFCSAGTILTACGGTGNAGPMANAGYGQVESISLQKFVVGPIAMESVPIAYLNNITLYAGYYSESSTEFVSDAMYTNANAENTWGSYHYDVGAITNNAAKLGISTVSAFAVQYKTPGQNADTTPAQIVRTGSGLVVVPNTTTTPIRGVVVYFHPTTFAKNDVPSCILGSGNVPAYCHSDKSPLSASAGLADFASFASIYAARGFVVVAPDYVGQGADWDNVHPYVAYPETNVLSAFYMFPAMRQILATKGVSAQTTLPLFITGYSEGGGYALKASQMAQGVSANILAENNLSLKITSPQEGAYSLTDQMNFAFADLSDGILNCEDNTSLGFVCGQSDAMESDYVTINPIVSQMNNWNIGSSAYAAATKPALTSYVLTAAMYYSFYNLSTAYDFAMNKQFWSDIPVLGSNNVIETLYGLYSGSGVKYTGSQISGSIVYNTTNINNYDVSAESYPVNFYLDPNLAALAQNFIPGFTGKVLPVPNGGLPPKTPGYGLNNQGSSFINQGIQTNPQFISLLANGSTYNWQTKSPINLIHMNYDSAVTVVNAHQAYNCMKYGKSFAGSGSLVGSKAACTTTPSGDLIESTIIANYQLTNNTQQLSPYDIGLYEVNKLAHSQFWSPVSNLIGNDGALAPLNAILGLPFDHGDMFVLGNIVALCTFENQLDGNSTNSGVCPDF